MKPIFELFIKALSSQKMRYQGHLAETTEQLSLDLNYINDRSGFNSPGLQLTVDNVTKNPSLQAFYKVAMNSLIGKNILFTTVVVALLFMVINGFF